MRDEDESIDKMMSEYTGADNDEYINEVISDFTTKGTNTPGNPDGVELTKFNGERACRKFVGEALHLSEEQQDAWMNEYFNLAWSRYDVNKAGSIQEAMLPTFFRSLLGSFQAQFTLSKDDEFNRHTRHYAD